MTASEILVTQKEKTEELLFSNFLFKNLELERETSSRYFTHSNMILMQFCLQGACAYQKTNAKKTIGFKTSEYNMVYIPKGEFVLSTDINEVNVLHIYIDEAFFFRQIPEGHIAFNHKNTNTFGLVFPKNLYINPKLKNVLNEMNTCEFDGHLKMLYLKAKIFELLTLQLAQHEEEKGIGLKESEIEKMMMVKELIENNLDESYSLAYLAKAAGTNEQYLKKHFKLLHGNTVFGYMLACKMQKAKDMLLTGNYRVTEIAEIIGYRHATHFTSAFKKFFGYLPKVLKTKFLVGSYFSLNIEVLEVLMAI